MSCAVLTEDVLARALTHALSGEERAALSRHLASPCEACLDLLARADGERLLIALAGQFAPTRAEADALYAKISAATASPLSPSPLVPPEAGGRGGIARALAWLFEAPRWQPALAAALVLVVAVPALLLSRGPERAGWTGLKGAADQAPSVSLTAFAHDWRAEKTRRLGPGEPHRRGEYVLLRYELGGAAAALYMIDAASGELLWQEEHAAPGEREISQDGKALALPPSRVEHGARLTLAACREPQPIERVRDGTAVGCSWAKLELAEEAP